MMSRSFHGSNYQTTPMDGNISTSPYQMETHQQLSSFTHKAPLLSTDMRCYFGCNQGFKKDWDLRLHLKLKHKNEDEAEMERAYQDAEDEIALTRRSLSVYQCVLCPKQYTGMGSFFGHIKDCHGMRWPDYKSQHGSCEIEQGPFQCQICDRVMKYDRNNVDRHLKSVHKITWPMYLDRIRQLRRGEKPDDLPTIQLLVCQICNSSVKDLRGHVKSAHRITEEEYADLVKDVNTSNLFKDRVPEDDRANTSLKAGAPEEFPCKPEVSTNFKSTTTSLQYAENSNSFPGPPKIDMMHQNCLIKMEKNIQPSKLEIKDKTNKSCSPCGVEFVSRRLFIEHCTKVHNMKFKTATGATISAPTSHFEIEYQKYTPMVAMKQEYGYPVSGKFMSIASPHSPTLNAYPYQKRSRPKEDLEPEESMNIGNESRYGRKIKRTSL